MYIPVLDLPSVESILRLSGIPKDERPDYVDAWETLFWAARRNWKQNEVDELIKHVKARGEW